MKLVINDRAIVLLGWCDNHSGIKLMGNYRIVTHS